MRYLIVLAVTLACAIPTVNGSGCRVVAVRRHVHHNYNDYAVQAVKIVQVVQPYYYGYYVPPPATPVGAEELKVLVEQLKAINERLNKVEGRPPDGKPNTPGVPNDPFAPPQALNANPALKLALANCASCHDKSNADGKGGGFALTDSGKLLEVTPEKLGELIDRMTTKDAVRAMPRGKAMSAEDRLLMINGLTGGK